MLLVSGCSFSIGSYESGLWYDQDKRAYNPIGFGIKADLVPGQMIIPVPKLGADRWDDPWLIVRAPIIAPFISFTMADKGGYAGFRAFEVSETNKQYYWWLNKDELPPRGKSYVYFTPEAAVRTQRYTRAEYTPADPLLTTHVPSWLHDLPPWVHDRIPWLSP
jgi:hypothetical protein